MAGMRGQGFPNPDRRALLREVGMRVEAKYTPAQECTWKGITLHKYAWESSPFLVTDVRLLPAQKSQTGGPRGHRMQVLCPCGSWVPFGRLNQHSAGRTCRDLRSQGLRITVEQLTAQGRMRAVLWEGSEPQVIVEANMAPASVRESCWKHSGRSSSRAAETCSNQG